MSLKSAFNMVWGIQAREVTLHNLDTDVQVVVKAAPANYFRNMSAPEEMVIEGMEYVFSKDNLDAASAMKLERGVKIIDINLGTNTISEVREMIIFGEIVGYRVRTN